MMTCECQTHGYCQRRKMHVPRRIHALCVAGQTERADALLRSLVEAREQRINRLIKSPPTPIHTTPTPPKNVGDVIHSRLAKLGITYTPTCGCDNLRIRYNNWGPATCHQYVDSIIDDLLQEARRRNLAIIPPRAFVKLFVLSAIRYAEKNK